MGGGEVAAIGQLTSALENNEASRVTSNLHCIIAIYIYILIVYIVCDSLGALFRSAN